MSLKLNRKGTTAYVNNHSALQGRDLPNQHNILSITGLVEALEEKYELPETGIPKQELGFDAVDQLELSVLKTFLQSLIRNTEKDVTINTSAITAIEDFLNSVFKDGDNGSVTDISKFAYKDGFRDEFIGEVGDDEFILSNKFIANNKTLKVYRDGELLIPVTDYVENSDTSILLNEPLETMVHMSFICENTSTVISPIHEEIILSQNQTELELKNSYIVNSNSLSIYIDGLRLENVADYKETSMNSVTLLNTYAAGTKVILRQEALASNGKIYYNNHDYKQASWVHVSRAKDKQTVVNFDNSYIVGASMLMVYCGGLLQTLGEGFDYIEIDEYNIKFNYELDENEEILVTTNVAVNDWNETFVSLKEQQIFVFSSPYNIGKNNIAVYESGLLLSSVNDYQEINSRTIKFIEPLDAGSVVSVYKRS